MMANLFSAFDPATSPSLSLNWLSTFIGFIIIPSCFWMIPSRYTMLIKIIYNKLHQEFTMMLGPASSKLSIIFISLFMFILWNNIMGLVPYVFTSSSHLVFTVTLALPFWISLMLFGWINHTKHMFAHLVPESCPAALMPFMVCVETISNIIRPISLAMRLTANMIAGHILMELLGDNITSLPIMIIPMIMIIQITLMLFETAVAVIQAYVFSVLSSLYTQEVAYEIT